MYTDEFVDQLAKAHVPRLIELLDKRLQNPVEQRWMDRKQAAQYLGKTERAIRALAEAGHIKEHGPTRAVLYDKQEIDRMLLESGRFVINGKRTPEDEEPEPEANPEDEYFERLHDSLPPLPPMVFGNDMEAYKRYTEFREEMIMRAALDPADKYVCEYFQVLMDEWNAANDRLADLSSDPEYWKDRLGTPYWEKERT
jgi:Helix-turn-helix domain